MSTIIKSLGYIPSIDEITNEVELKQFVCELKNTYNTLNSQFTMYKDRSYAANINKGRINNFKTFFESAMGDKFESFHKPTQITIEGNGKIGDINLKNATIIYELTQVKKVVRLLDNQNNIRLKSTLYEILSQ